MKKLVLLVLSLIVLAGCSGVDWFPSSSSSSSTASGANPQAFTFTPMSSVALNATVTSSAVTITGNSQPAAITVSNGLYSIDGGSYTASAGTINAGQKVAVQQTSASTPGTSTYTVLTVGNVVAVFTSKTRTVNPTPPTEIAAGSTDSSGIFTLVDSSFTEAFRNTTSVTEQVILDLSYTTAANYTAEVGFVAVDANGNPVYTGYLQGPTDGSGSLQMATNVTIDSLTTYASIANWFIFSIQATPTTP